MRINILIEGLTRSEGGSRKRVKGFCKSEFLSTNFLQPGMRKRRIEPSDSSMENGEILNLSQKSSAHGGWQLDLLIRQASGGDEWCRRRVQLLQRHRIRNFLSQGIFRYQIYQIKGLSVFWTSGLLEKVERFQFVLGLSCGPISMYF